MQTIPQSLEQLDNSKFERKIVKIWKAMKYMEKHKYLEPKFSEGFGDLAKHLAQF